MTLIIDAPVIASNASVIRAICEDAALVPAAVFKSAYALPEIIAATVTAGIERFAASSSRAAMLVTRISGRDCGLIGPAVPRSPKHLSRRICSVMVSRPEEARHRIAAGAPFVWLSVMTSDGRDGVTADRLPWLIRELLTLPGANGRLGIALNWGCLGGRPPIAELAETSQLLAGISARAGKPLPLSLGGSALLPLVGSIELPGACELRIGEAILTGRIPDGDGRILGLRAPIRLSATVVDCQTRPGGARRLLLDRGWTSIEAGDVRIRGIRGKAVTASAEVSIFDLAEESRAPKIGEAVDLLLGYKSTLRALLNRTIPRRLEGSRLLSEVRRPGAAQRPAQPILLAPR